MPKLALLTAIGGPIELAEFPLSTPAPGTAALKLRMAGICGSDLHIFRGELPLPCPDATGKPLGVGDRVVTPYFWLCGQCHAYARGRPYACQNLMAGRSRRRTGRHSRGRRIPQQRRNPARGRQHRDG
jgi:threonine dehydrogenase-like Zn-dependent dehydrogenase